MTNFDEITKNKKQMAAFLADIAFGKGCNDCPADNGKCDVKTCSDAWLEYLIKDEKNGGAEMSNGNRNFRVWDKLDKKYILDRFFLLDADGNLYIFIAGTLHLLNDSEKARYIIEFCTGIRDKNKQLIYDGDKIRFEDANVDGVVEFTAGGFCFKWKYNTVLLAHVLQDKNGHIDSHDLEILGNIHEVEK